ncbi:MAG: hypothetical protein ONB05_02620 [candidate division KSB1 bacterium]|nr:hypothetical protein [candidate division KSB1 bacterium]
MISFLIFMAIVLLFIVFFMIAGKKGWIVKNPRGSFTSQVVMHQFSPKERQQAMEYVMDKQEPKQKRDARQDEDKD